MAEIKKPTQMIISRIRSRGERPWQVQVAIKGMASKAYFKTLKEAIESANRAYFVVPTSDEVTDGGRYGTD